MKKLLTIAVILSIFILSACDIFSPSNSYSFDISKLSDTTTASRAYTVPSQDDSPFCNFAKYQIDVLYIQVSLVTPAGWSEHHTILNRDEDNPVELDLAVNKLSDVIDLTITDAKGYIVSGATIGIGRRFVMNGTLYNDTNLMQTTSTGMSNVSGSAAPQDWTYYLPEDTYTKINPEDMEGELPVAELVYGINLNTWGTDNIELSDGGVFELKYPLEQGLVGNGNYAPCSLENPSPYIEGQTNYEIYYAKTADTSYYTEWWRFIFDNDGNLINEGGQGGTITSGVDLGLAFGTWITDENPELSASFEINSDGSYLINSDKGEVTDERVIFTNLRRLDVGASGSVNIEHGTDSFVLEYKRVQ